MKKIKLKITTPERIVLEDEVDQITLPTESGEITILPNHVPIVSVVTAGVLETKKEEEITPMAVSGGFLEFHENEITILANTAERADEIDLERAEEARKRAEEKKETVEKITDSEYLANMHRLEKQLARIKLARKYNPRKKRPTINSSE